MSNIIDSIQLSGVTYQIQGSGGGGVPESTFTAYTATTDERISQDEEVTAAGLNALNDKITPTVELTQAQYDALVDKDPNTYYIITDATPVDMSNYYTTAQTNTLLAGKQATLVSGTNIKTINNESLLGSGNINIQGGSTYAAGRGISIANDTISFSLPISAGTGTNSIAEGENTTASGMYGSHAEGNHTSAIGWGAHAEGNRTTASGNYSHTEGGWTTASGIQSHAEGDHTTANNLAEHASGSCNVSRKASTTFGDSGNTLFSVGNGTGINARHNAFEIRQNGDIYLTLNGQDVKLQDQLGGSSITVDTALDSGSTNPVENRVIYNKIDEVEEVTAAALNELNEAVSGKQDTLVSGTNIKTINNTSILGSGNIDIQGGGGGVNVVQTTGTSTTDVMSQDAVTTVINTVSGAIPSTYVSAISADSDAGYQRFYRFSTPSNFNYFLLNNAKINNKAILSTSWGGFETNFSLVETSAITTSVTSSSTDAQVPSAKAVNDALGGLKLVKLTQAQYDALTIKDASTLYIILG